MLRVTVCPGSSLRNGSMFEFVIAMCDEEKVALANFTTGRLLSFDFAEAAGCPLLAVARKLTELLFPPVHESKYVIPTGSRANTSLKNVIVTHDEVRILR